MSTLLAILGLFVILDDRFPNAFGKTLLVLFGAPICLLLIPVLLLLADGAYRMILNL